MQLTPWVITESFVKGYLEKGGDGMLRLFGLGDPSGVGEGFSLLRCLSSPSPLNSSYSSPLTSQNDQILWETKWRSEHLQH
jgi:hypothetical protein